MIIRYVTHTEFLALTERLREEGYVRWPYYVNLNWATTLPFQPYNAADWLYDLIYDNDNGDLR